MDRIIFQRRGERRSKERFFNLSSSTEYSGVSTFLQELHEIQHSYKFFQSSRAILHTKLILLQEFSKKYYNYKAHPVQITTRHLLATAPRASKHSTRQNPVIRLPTAFQGHTAQAGFQQFYLAETAFYTAASIHAVPTVAPRRIPTRILPGEIGFFPKGLSIVYPIQY